MKIGYARVSTEDQNPDLQLTALKRAGCSKIFTDKATGANAKRSELAKCLKALKAGDVLTVWKLDRLGRSLRDLIALLDDLKAQRLGFRSLTEAYRHGRKLIEQGEGPNNVAKSFMVSRRTLYRALTAP